MLIAFDGRPLQPEARHWGIGTVIDNVVNRLSHEFIFRGLAPRFEHNDGHLFRMWPNIQGLNRIAFEFSPLMALDIDLYWGPNHVIPAAVRRPSVLTVHDLVLLKYPEEQRWGKLWAMQFISSVRRAQAIITDSRTTADDLASRLPGVSKKIEVGLLGFDSPRLNTRPIDYWPAPYAIVLGAHRIRKNLGLAISAVEAVRRKGLRMSLVITGDIDPAFMPSVYKHSEFVKPVGVLKKQKLFDLLRGAVALLFPSVYEGFGFPMLEAMASECPVIALDTPINKEVGGSAIRTLAPQADFWSDTILELSRESHLRQEMIGLGKLNIKRFSWDSTANVYRQIFRENS